MFNAVGYPEVLHGFHLALEVSELRSTTIWHYISDTKKFLEYCSEILPLEITYFHSRQYLALFKKKRSAKMVYEFQLAVQLGHATPTHNRPRYVAYP